MAVMVRLRDNWRGLHSVAACSGGWEVDGVHVSNPALRTCGVNGLER